MNANGPSEERQKTQNEKEDRAQENKFVSHVALPNLQKMASYAIVETVFRGYSARLRNGSRGTSTRIGRLEDFNLNDGDQEACYRLVESLRTPRPVEKLLFECLDEILEEVRNWLTACFYLFHTIPQAVFDKYNHLRCDSSRLVWLPDGKIDYKNSAAQISLSDEINPVLKFLLMSAYCLRDQIDTFDWRSLPEEYVKAVTFTDERCLTYYWLCYLKDELDKVPKSNYSSPEAAMAVKCIRYYKWSSFEYFWTCLDAEDQISVGKTILSGSQSETDCYQSRILSKMTWHQQQVLLSEIPADIISRFVIVRRPNWEQHAMWAWTNSKDTMTSEEFNKLEWLLIAQTPKYRFFGLVWGTVPVRFQRRIVEYIDSRIETLFQSSGVSASDFRLLCKYMSQRSDSFWRHFVLSNVDQFANFAGNPRSMHEFVKLALPRTHDLSQFKQSLAESEMMTYSCLRLLGSGKPEFVSLKLKFCLADHRAVEQYTMSLLMQTRTLEKGFYYVDIDKWLQMSDFIDRAFAGDATKATKKKKHAISSYVARWPHKNDRIEIADEKRFGNLVEIIETLFEGEELKAIKKSFVRSFIKIRTNPMWRSKFVSRKFFQKFILRWCLIDDENATREFKESLSKNMILAAFFSHLCAEYRQWRLLKQSILKDLDFYLEWYLGSEQEAKKCKADKFPKIFDDFDIFNTFWRGKDQTSLTVLMKWAFSGDEKQIRSFEAKNAYLTKQ